MSAATKGGILFSPSSPCPDQAGHTVDPTEPRGYVAWHEWSEWMAKRSHQRQCPTCHLWAIWAPTGHELGYGQRRHRGRQR